MNSNSIRACALGLLLGGLFTAAAAVPGSTQATAGPAVKPNIPCDNGPYRDGKGSLFEDGCLVAAFANWPGRIKARNVNDLIHAVDLDNPAEDPFEQRNLAAAHPDKVAAMQARLNALGKESTKPPALIYVTRVGLAHGKPLMASEGGEGSAMVENHGYAITDEGFGETEVEPDRH